MLKCVSILGLVLWDGSVGRPFCHGGYGTSMAIKHVVLEISRSFLDILQSQRLYFEKKWVTLMELTFFICLMLSFPASKLSIFFNLGPDLESWSGLGHMSTLVSHSSATGDLFGRSIDAPEK